MILKYGELATGIHVENTKRPHQTLIGSLAMRLNVCLVSRKMTRQCVMCLTQYAENRSQMLGKAIRLAIPHQHGSLILKHDPHQWNASKKKNLLSAFRWRFAFGCGVLVSHCRLIVSCVFVAHRLQQLGVVFTDLVERVGELASHVATDFAIGRIFATLFVKHLLNVCTLRQLGFNSLHLLKHLRIARICFTNSDNVPLNSVNLVSQDLGFRLRHDGIDRRDSRRVLLDAARVIASVLNVSRRTAVREERSSIVSRDFVIDSHLCVGRLPCERRECGQDRQTKN